MMVMERMNRDYRSIETKGCHHSALPVRRCSSGGFTLAEILLATVVGSLVVIVALVALRTVSESRAQAEVYSELNAAGRYAMNRIRDDLANTYLGGVEQSVLFVGTVRNAAAPASTDWPDKLNQVADRLRLYIVSDESTVDGEELQADVFEVEYGLLAETPDEQCWLGRRIAPVQDPQSGNKQGLLTRIAGHIVSLEFDYFDGTAWQRQWQKSDELPRMVRVSLQMASQSSGGQRLGMSQTISLRALPDTLRRPSEIVDTRPTTEGGTY